VISDLLRDLMTFIQEWHYAVFSGNALLINCPSARNYQHTLQISQKVQISIYNYHDNTLITLIRVVSWKILMKKKVLAFSGGQGGGEFVSKQDMP